MERLPETLKILREARAKSAKCLVGFSGGKDSLIVMDLCVRTFEHVEAYFMYFIPGLECIEVELEAARKRWGVTIHQYPHWGLANAMRESGFIQPRLSLDNLPDTKLKDIQKIVSDERGIKMIASGARKADSLWRRRQLAKPGNYHVGTEIDCIFPIIGWTKRDVLAYLTKHGIPIPDSDGGSATGIGLATPALLWLHDKHPADFRKLCEVFPYAESVVWRRTWYGVA